jgi:hypothetical protein
MKDNKKTFLGDMISNIKDDVSSTTGKRDIPDIMTFCDSPEWLGLPSHPVNPITLYPMQRIMLKIFYRGSIGNENIKLEDSEIELLKDLGLVDEEKGDVVGKYEKGEIFKELVLVWGRRASKDFFVSLIALYEAMKLLECEGGDPYAYYEIASGNTINILTVANSADQAHLAFAEIKGKLLYSPYFSDKYNRDGIGSSAIHLLTPSDKEQNKKFAERGISSKKGSIGIVVGHSNSDTLLGKQCITLILDEVASYKNTKGASGGDRIYTALTPTVKTFVRKEYEKDENGEYILDEIDQRIIKDRRYDGKIISISSPRSKEGKFYELFSSASEDNTRLVQRLPTWDVNPTHTRDSLRTEAKIMSESEFNMEFGAEWGGTGKESFFTEDQVNACFRGHNLLNKEMGVPGVIYFAHLDPATNSHNYALVVAHKEFYLDMNTQKAEYRIVIDHIKHWEPSAGSPISIKEVDEYVVKLKKRFRIVLLTYDQWNSQESVAKLKKASIPNKLTRFNMAYKMLIYREVENLINMGRIQIPHYDLLRSEMLHLQRKFTPNGFKVFPKPDGDGAKTDDIIDCVAGVCYTAIQQAVNQLPRAKVIDTGGQYNNMVWRSMQGVPYGVGSGKQVAAQMERRSQVTHPMLRR